ncbi:MAG: signal recognition particle protein [Micavibrio aeruginosavorus]|uniref:Signal recognition particle protein n=1 Tax=Micavibrio aeruginosavorus TaxID=349221 RepID=A0A2W5MWV5_9BACT|nr:MAG: signal recognition particle protein [Micavibrio aeruginosavorus]
MFESLSDKLGNIFSSLRGKTRLTEEDVNMAAREIRVALLEADVALPVVKDFIESVKAKAVGQDVIKSVTPGQMVVKIVHDALVEMLGSDTSDLTFGPSPSSYLMVGLQGSGKTTSTAKIAKYLSDKGRKKVLMASLDTSRPAAQEQLGILGQQTGVATLEIIKGETPIQITERALKEARLGGFDILMLDTAGRLSIDEELMNEVAAVSKLANPVEKLLVADAMTGQDAVNVAKAFDEKVGITGIVLTRIDGDARGGAALSMRAVTGKPIKLLGVGEKWDALEPFHPDRIAGRILGMGDVVSLVERAAESIEAEDAERMAAKFNEGKFDFNDLLAQFRQMNKMGGIGAMVKMLPGLGKMASQIEGKVDDNVMKRQEAIILSMTKAEREKPQIMNASRRRRIAEGSGTTVQDVNKLCKQQADMQTMMKRMKKMGMGKMMGMMKGMMGDRDAAMLDEQMAEEAAASGAMPNLGANPFAGGMPKGLPGLGGMGGLPGLGGMPMGGFPQRGGTKKNRKKR